MHATGRAGQLDYSVLKRAIDVVVSGALLVLMAPMFIVIAALIKIQDRGPVLYVQERVGSHGTLFNIYKFRTMTHVDRRVHLQTFDDSEGVTRVGKYLRRLKLDETPQLFNVLRGDLSLVGPRPCLPETLEEFGSHAEARHSVRPGITGLAQVNGNVLLDWKERLQLDLEYVRTCSLWVDLRILFKTLGIIVHGEAWGRR